MDFSQVFSNWLLSKNAQSSKLKSLLLLLSTISTYLNSFTFQNATPKLHPPNTITLHNTPLSRVSLPLSFFFWSTSLPLSKTHDSHTKNPPIHKQRHRGATATGVRGTGGIRLRGNPGGAPLRPYICGGPHRHRPLHLAPPCPGRRRRREIAGAGASQQGTQEEGGELAAEIHLRRQQPRQVGGLVGVRHLPLGVRRRRRGPGSPPVRPRIPRGVYRHVARVPLLVPLVPRPLRRRQVPEMRPVPTGSRRRSHHIRRRRWNGFKVLSWRQWARRY